VTAADVTVRLGVEHDDQIDQLECVVYLDDEDGEEELFGATRPMTLSSMP